jgi:hypothetical protein
MMGNNMDISDADAQFAALLIGMRLGSRTSGIYSHTIGPNDKPKSAI